ncbi:hypothetical protein HPB50_004330 [Hyalomma asiaticum]|uniref:Uncharacterized protein n=1 Tax=Hyalomma asiaticum TaxID=266040 RepID=A0ACB7SMM0_HYAAI|nr:hypothetical protein HPB50_004330 [Hyalomma asiaticum]
MLEPPVHTLLFVPLTTTDSLNQLNRQATSVSDEALASGQISDVSVNSRENVFAIGVKQCSAMDVLCNVTLLGYINVRSYILHGRYSTAGVIGSQIRSLSARSAAFCAKDHFSAGIALRWVTLVLCARAPSYSRYTGGRTIRTPAKQNNVAGNCDGPHHASSKVCPYIKEMQVLRQMVRGGSTHREAAAKVRRGHSHRRVPSKSMTKPTDEPLPQSSSSPLQASGKASKMLPKKERGITGRPETWPALPTRNRQAQRCADRQKLLRNRTVAIVMKRKS